jgi:hypothetical protein
VGFVRETSLKLTRLQTPSFRCRFHGWRCDGQIEKTYGGLVGLEFPRHSSRPLLRLVGHNQKAACHQSFWYGTDWWLLG